MKRIHLRLGDKMKKTVDMIIKNKYIKDFNNDSPLIFKEALENINKLNDEGMLVNLYNENKHFIGKGFYGKQNKGYGWIVSRDENEEINEAFFIKKIQAAVDYRSDFYADKETTAFRVFNGEGDGFGGFTIDYFAGYYLVTWYSVGIFTFKEDILNALEKVTKCTSIYEKKRFNDKGKYVEANDFVWGEEAPEPLIVKENGVNFAIYLNDGPMVGVFLDQREVRKTIRDSYSEGKTVLNTFSYTGAFSVFAALGGASKTTSVDLANRSRAKTREQFEINDINPDDQGIIVEDVFNYFKYAGRKELKFDLVVLDPPSFARSKKRTFSAAKDYVGLMVDAINITKNNGVIVASTNYSNFDMRKFKQFIDVAFRETKTGYKILDTFSLPKDFKVSNEYPAGDYLKVVFVKKFDR